MKTRIGAVYMSLASASLMAACLVACGAPKPAAGPSATAETSATGPVIGPAMTPAPKASGNAEPSKGELLAPATFPAAKKPDLILSMYVPGTVDAALRTKFAAAEEAFGNGDDSAADKLYAALPKTGPLAPWLALARIRLRARKEEWPTSVGAGEHDAHVASAITTLGKLDLSGVPHSALGPFLLEQGRWLLVHGDYEYARTALDNAVKTLPEEAEVQSLLGLSRLASGQVQAALEPLERAAALDLGGAARWGNLGTVRMMNGKINEAARAYEARVRLSPNDPQAHADYGIALVQISEITHGIKELNEATSLDPERATYWSNLGYALDRAGKRGESRTAYDRALANDPKLIVGLLGLSALLSESRIDLPEARRVFAKAEKLAPDDPRVLAAKADLDELEKKAR